MKCFSMLARAAIGLCLAVLGVRVAPCSEACVTVLDLVGLPLPDASVVATNLTTSKMASGGTDERGTYCFPSIPEGLYSFESGLRGFLNVRYYPVHVTFSKPAELEFRLPFGETEEGISSNEAMINGTLRRAGGPVGNASICVMGQPNAKPIRCAQTTELGEYAIAVPPGIYYVEIRLDRSGEVRPLFSQKSPVKLGADYRVRLDVSSPGDYRNRLSLPGDQGDRGIK